jgi:hypothetical protein
LYGCVSESRLWKTSRNLIERGYSGARPSVSVSNGWTSYSHCFRFSFGVDSMNAEFRGDHLMRSMVKGVALLCLLLTLWSAGASIAHHHSNATESVKCTVCVVAHSAAPKPTAILQNATFVQLAVFRPQVVSVQQCLLAFALNVRPPPES